MTRSMIRPWRVVAVLVATAILSGVAGCADDTTDPGQGADATVSVAPTTDTTAPPPLTVLVTNDDGVGSEGIDAIAEALASLPGIEVVVVAPDSDRSGTGSNSTPGGAAASPSVTLSGRPATAVAGFPVDAVRWALDGGVAEEPHLVVSGINPGANVGPFVDISGTVGAATEAAVRGVPALAVSQGKGEGPVDWSVAIGFALDWVQERRPQLAARTAGVLLENLNVPTCTAGTIRGVLEVPVQPDGQVPPGAVDCSAAPPPALPADDLAAFAAGWATRSPLPVPVPSTP
jgi:5'-nucleotidase